ncbi:hypothetical protein ABGN05_20190 [Aquibium sp. LZ166]|uniref:Uncharacterized protein n=1 Tax=Aquibium pacificus TaxID=3153579 RepID=A0ABV3SMH4_9HYPH
MRGSDTILLFHHSSAVGAQAPRPALARRLAVGLFAAGMAFSSTPSWSGSCGLCARQVVINPSLAECLLGNYEVLATGGDGGAIAVDLTDCEQSRGIVEALPSAAASPPEPDLRFLVSRGQLDCLKRTLERPGAVVDPVTTIDLSACE